MNRWAEAFAIFDRYGLGDHDVHGYHDLITVNVNKPLTTSPDGQRLLELGWHKSDHIYDDDDNIVGYYEESDWEHYT